MSDSVLMVLKHLVSSANINILNELMIEKRSFIYSYTLGKVKDQVCFPEVQLIIQVSNWIGCYLLRHIEIYWTDMIQTISREYQ